MDCHTEKLYFEQAAGVGVWDLRRAADFKEVVAMATFASLADAMRRQFLNSPTPVSASLLLVGLELSVPTLNMNLSLTGQLFRPRNRFRLRRKQRTRTLRVGLLHRPVVTLLHYKNIIMLVA